MPGDVLVNQIFGMSTGMALFPITFDWSQITGYVGSPLTTRGLRRGMYCWGLFCGFGSFVRCCILRMFGKGYIFRLVRIFLAIAG